MKPMKGEKSLMLVVTYKRNFLIFAETYDMKLDNTSKTDVQIASWLNTDMSPGTLPPDQKRGFCIIKKVKTHIIDLAKSESEIFTAFQKSVRYKINRAVREGITFTVLDEPTDQDIEEFANFFNEFAKTKKIMLCLPDKMKALRDKKALVITIAKHEGKTLCCHGYIFNGNRAIMLYSASSRAGKDSAEKNFIGRANRFLHWNSILFLKEKGCRWYDFCGLSQDPNDKEGQGINDFKKGFGGFTADEVKFYTGYSLLGKLVIFISYLKWKKTPEYLNARTLFMFDSKGGT
jgi:lipid II:glycine glycyltransferase (peptidoglycan interpeptide bridge formation enzyme)